MPLLVRGGGFPQDVIADQLVANIDLAPTIVALAGATPSLEMDGLSLLPLAIDSSLGRSRDLLIETIDLDANRNYQAVRTQSFLYVEHVNGKQELYDMRRGTKNYDPYQLQSRHAERAYARIKKILAIKLKRLRTCSATSCNLQ